jgi:hypothetical protein
VHGLVVLAGDTEIARTIENETELSFFNRELYEAYKAHPEVCTQFTPIDLSAYLIARRVGIESFCGRASHTSNIQLVNNCIYSSHLDIWTAIVYELQHLIDWAVSSSRDKTQCGYIAKGKRLMYDNNAKESCCN